MCHAENTSSANSSSSTSGTTSTTTTNPAGGDKKNRKEEYIAQLGDELRDQRVALSEIPIVDLGPLLASSLSSSSSEVVEGDDDGIIMDENDPSDLKQMASSIHHALANVGFMYITNHGISSRTIDNAMEMTKQFFALPIEEKKKLNIESTGIALHGYTGYYGENTDITGQTRDYKEIFDFGRRVSLSSSRDGQQQQQQQQQRQRPFFGPTPWPSKDILPNMEVIMMEYHDAMLDLSRKLMIALSLSLNLDKNGNYFHGMMKEPIGIQRILHYPSQQKKVVGDDDIDNNDDNDDDDESEEEEEEDEDDSVNNNNVGDAEEKKEEDKPPPKTKKTRTKKKKKTATATTVGIGAHTDYGCLTILAQDDVGGLQVLNRDGLWINAPPIPNTFIINIGDMIQRLTNDTYIANLHRVTNLSGKDRYSIPFFFDVDYDTIFEPLEVCTSVERPAKYGPVVCGEHKWARYQKSYSYLRNNNPSTSSSSLSSSTTTDL